VGVHERESCPQQRFERRVLRREVVRRSLVEVADDGDKFGAFGAKLVVDRPYSLRLARP
jgi:hypothetical protein